MIQILIVDDQRLMREGLRTLLEREPDLEIVDLAPDGLAAVDIVRQQLVDVVLMDIRMPSMDGITATGEIMQLHRGTKVLMLTTFDDVDDVAGAIAAGAVGYLMKDMPAEVIAAAIRTAHQGGAVLPPHLAKSMLTSTAPRPVREPAMEMHVKEPLTDREIDILRCLAQGMSNREIAEQLFLTEGTVKNHVSNVIAKLGLRDRTQAALFAVRHGFGADGA